MFLGLLHDDGEAVSPKVLSRIPSEDVVWSAEYSSQDTIVFVNSRLIKMFAFKTIHRTISKIAWFREVDDMKPFTPVSDTGSFYHRVRKDDCVVLPPRALQCSLRFRSNEPNIEDFTDTVDKLTDTTMQHLHFIHDIAFTATGDLRVLARNYLKAHGGFNRVR